MPPAREEVVIVVVKYHDSGKLPSRTETARLIGNERQPGTTLACYPASLPLR